MAQIDFARLRDLVHEFEQVLSDHGLRIVESSSLEHICLFLQDLEGRRSRRDPVDLHRDIRPDWRMAVGLADLLLRILRVARTGGLPPFLRHLRLLNTSMPAQNVRAVCDQGSSKLFELLVGLLCHDVGSEVLLDDPNRSTGDNPDVLFTYAGTEWGFACKVIDGTSPLSFFDNLEKGIGQIERSPASRGCVVFSMKNMIDHDLLWPLLNPASFRSGMDPLFGGWSHIDCPATLLRNTAAVKADELAQAHGPEHILALFEGKKTAPFILQILQSATGLIRGGHPATALVNTVAVTPFADMHQTDMALIGALNDALQCFGESSR